MSTLWRLIAKMKFSLALLVEEYFILLTMVRPWKEIDSGLTSLNIYSLYLDSDGQIFAGTNNGVFRSKESTTLTIPERFDLKQNYPNPFNEITFIPYDLSDSVFVELEILNILGQKIETLISQQQKAGEYKVEWQPANVSSGVYI